MKIFLDTANVGEIKKAHDTGMLNGVTTNPTLASKENKSYKQILKEVTAFVNGPVSAEAVSLDTAGMVKEGKEFAKIHKNIIVKVPNTPEGLKAVQILKKSKILCNVTLTFSANQALLAAKAGAYVVSPFIGRLDDQGFDGMQLIDEIVTIYQNYDFKTEVLVASIRHPLHVTQAALIGADICTVPYGVFQKLFKHPMTDIGIKTFLEDWKKAKK